MYKLAEVRIVPLDRDRNRVDFIFVDEATGTEKPVSLTKELTDVHAQRVRTGVKQGWDRDWRWEDIPEDIKCFCEAPAIVSVLRTQRR